MADDTGEPKYLEHWTDDDIAKWKAKRPELRYVVSGSALKVEVYQERTKREWAKRVGTPFPGYSLEALEQLASGADIPMAEWKRFTAGEIYRLAIEKLDPQTPKEFAHNGPIESSGQPARRRAW